MSERFQNDVPNFRAPDLIELFQPLPGWLADRLLKPDEKVTWVRGPSFNPSWECYVTHPALFVLALALGAMILGLGWLVLGGIRDLQEILMLVGLAASLLVLASIIILGIANGYFTRLVVTNFRLVILQGYEIVRSWSIDDLPHSLIRYRRRDGEDRTPCIDLEAVKTMLGGSSSQFTDAKSILSFGKQLDRIKTRDRDHG
jgi:hypothetical protein